MFRRFLAGMLCASMLAANDGTAVVYATVAENTQEEKEISETEDGVKDTEEADEQGPEEKILEPEPEDL